MKTSLAFAVKLVLLSTILAGCAQVIPPSGGERDTTPPEVINTTPKNKSLNFKAKSFYIEFDEFVQLNDIYNQLLVSPPLEKNPVVTIKRKGVLVELDEELKPNTTYTFNFGSGVTDFNEGNPAEDLVYVFSTGPELDSLGVSGRVIDAYTTEPASGVKVMLYQSDVDSLPLTKKPYYFGLTGEMGEYQIGFMKGGDYKVFTLKEELSNYIYDAPTEKIGFLDSLITAQKIDSTMQRTDLRIFREASEEQFIDNYRTDSTGFLSISFKMQPEELAFNVLTLGVDTASVYEEFEGDSVYFWLTGEAPDEKIDLEIRDRDKVLDTLRIPFENREIVPKTKYSLELGISAGTTVKSEDEVYITSSAYLQYVDTSLISLQRDSVEMDFSIDRLDDSYSRLLVNADFEDDERYEMQLLPGAITDRIGFSNDTTTFSFGTFPADHYGSFLLNVTGFQIDSGKGILQLVKDDDNVVNEQIIKVDGEFSYKRIKPGSYRLRLIFDENDNGQWDTGNYNEKIQPEQVLFLPKEISVRSNWDLEMEWQINDNSESE